MHKAILRKNSRGRLDRRDMKGLRNTDSPKPMETRAIGKIQRELPVCLVQKNPERERTGRVLKGRAPGIDGGQPGMMAVPLIHQDRVVIPDSGMAVEVHHRRGITMIRMPGKLLNRMPDSRRADSASRKNMKRQNAGWMWLKRS